MKKILILLSIITLFCYCSKQDVLPEPEEVEVSFSFNNILESGNITRSTFTDEVLGQLSYKYPERFGLYCLSGTAAGKSYHVSSATMQGNTLSIQKGEYIVYSMLESGDNVECWPSAEIEVPLEVKIEERIKTTNWSYYGYRINITESKTYTIDVQINCLLLGSKKEETSGIWWRCPDASGDWHDSRALQTVNYYYTILRIPSKYFKSSSASNKLEIKLGETEYSEETVVSTTVSKVSTGKYLLLTPNSKDVKIFNMDIFNSWEESYE